MKRTGIAIFGVLSILLGLWFLISNADRLPKGLGSGISFVICGGMVLYHGLKNKGPEK